MKEEAAAQSSSPPFIKTYDVFLSVRGEDTSFNFNGNLYLGLCQRGIVTFIDDVDLRNEGEIEVAPPYLMSTIHKSRTAIIIFSRNYASSAFCLDELVQILQCHSKGKIRIFPVYYGVDPSDVRHQTGSYGEAFAKHEHKQGTSKDGVNKLQEWRSALSTAAAFSGFLFKQVGGEPEEHVIIEQIIETVSGELAVGAIPSPLIQNACDMLASPQVLDFFRGNESLVNNFENKLRSVDVLAVDAEQTLQKIQIQSLAADAEQKLQKQSLVADVKEWLLAIKDILFAVLGILDEIDNALFERKVKAESRTSFDKEIKSTMEQVLHNLEDLPSPFLNIGLKKATSGIDVRSSKLFSDPSIPKLPPYNMELTDRVFGRQKEKDDVVKLLLDSSDHNMSIVGIVGHGGIGKTTLARLVYKDRNVRKSFQLRLWIPFPSCDKLEAATLAKVILRMLKVSFDKHDPMLHLPESLCGKRLLLVLDGCCSVHEWKKLRTCFESAARGSAIILTTRNTRIISEMLADHILHLDVLSMEHCWSLFSDRCFGNQRHNCSPELEMMGKEILRKCKGVPLAVEMLGGFLHKKDHVVWRKLCSQHWDKDNRNFPTPYLMLCYLDLPVQLRRCITYLTTFPKRYNFQKSQVVLLWMAKGLIQRGNDEAMEKQGNKYFDFLLARSFFMRSNSGGIMYFTMHDMVHDLALFVSAKSSILDQYYESIYTSSLISNIQNVEESLSELYGSKMEEYIPLKDDTDTDTANITHDLDQQSPKIEGNLPITTNDVVQTTFESGTHHFNTLRISDAPPLVELPSQLHSLRIERCHSFKSIHDVLMDKSTNLFELFIIDCSFLEYFTDGPCPTSLRTLYVHKCGKLEFLISLEKMQNFKFLENLFIGSSCDSLKSFPMNLFPKLKILCIWDCPNLESLSTEECQSNNLSLSLESLEIRNCSNLVSFPTQGLLSPCLRSLSISNCKKLRSLPTCMTTLTSLQSIYVVKCPELDSLQGLPSCLKLLSIAFCDKLIPQKDWNLQALQCLNRFEIESGCMGLKSFPEKDLLPVNLNSLYISKLPSLELLDHDGLQQLTTLKSLEINCCEKVDSLPEFLPSSLTLLCIRESTMLSEKLLSQTSKDWLKIAPICKIQIDNNFISQE